MNVLKNKNCGWKRCGQFQSPCCFDAEKHSCWEGSLQFFFASVFFFRFSFQKSWWCTLSACWRFSSTCQSFQKSAFLVSSFCNKFYLLNSLRSKQLDQFVSKPKFGMLLFSGRFDFVGSSHQIWHGLVMAAFLWWHQSGQQLLLYRSSHQCVIDDTLWIAKSFKQLKLTILYARVANCYFGSSIPNSYYVLFSFIFQVLSIFLQAVEWNKALFHFVVSLCCLCQFCNPGKKRHMFHSGWISLGYDPFLPLCAARPQIVCPLWPECFFSSFQTCTSNQTRWLFWKC